MAVLPSVLVHTGVVLQRLPGDLQSREAGTPDLCDGAVMLGWSCDKRPEHVQVLLQHLVCEAARANREFYVVLADVRKAFDMFQWVPMREALAEALSAPKDIEAMYIGIFSSSGLSTIPRPPPSTVVVSQLSRYPSRGRRVIVAGTKVRSSKVGIRLLNVL